MDCIDKKILKILSEDSSTTATELATMVNLSIPAVNKRIQKMKQTGVIRRFTLQINPEAVGKPISAYMLLVLQQGAKMETLMEYIQSDPDVLECNGVTGEYDYLLRICASNVAALQKKINRLKKHGGVVKSHTLLCLSEHKNSASVMPDAEEEEI